MEEGEGGETLGIPFLSCRVDSLSIRTFTMRRSTISNDQTTTTTTTKQGLSFEIVLRLSDGYYYCHAPCGGIQILSTSSSSSSFLPVIRRLEDMLQEIRLTIFLFEEFSFSNSLHLLPQILPEIISRVTGTCLALVVS